MVLALVGIRIFHSYESKVHKKFADEWEPKLFEFMGSDISSKEFLGPLESKQVYNLLIILRKYLNLLTGNDFDKISSLLLSKKVQNYFSSSLKSLRIKKNIEVIYYLGIFKNNTFKKKVAKFLNHKNDVLFSQAARSLARINATEYIDSILTLSTKHKRISFDTLYAVLIEFNNDACENMHEYLDKTNDNKVKSVIVAALTHFKYQNASEKVLKFLLYSHCRELLIQALKYFAALEYYGAANALRIIFLKSSQEIISQAIKTSSKISNPELEQLIYKRLFQFNWQNKIDAVNALYEMSEQSRRKLIDLAENLDYPVESSIAKMVLSEREVIEA